MKTFVSLTIIVLFTLGSFLIGDDHATSTSDATIFSWMGVSLILAGLGLIPILSVIDKFKKK